MTQERGITLIALIITIVLLVILTAVVIRGITGENGLIKTSKVAAEENNITSYKEQIEQKVRGTVLKYAAEGSKANVNEIAESLREESTWIKTASADTNVDIIAVTTEGQIYQIYYDNIYGLIYIEYIGEDDGKEIPKITARYESIDGKIYVEAKDSVGKIEKIELIYRGEILGDPIENPEGEVSFNVKDQGTGWYKIKATSSTGKVRYAWVKKVNIKENLTAPDITIEAEGEAVNGWYGGDGKALYVRISTDNPYAKEIHYTLSGATQKEEVIEKIETGTGERSIKIKIEASGITRIVGTIEDGENNSSNYSIEDVKYDNEKPVIKEIQVIGIKGNEEWYTGDVEIKVITDDIKSVYYYKVIDKEGNIIKDKTRVASTDTEIRLERDGEYKIEIELEDLAGNKSEPKEITVKRDTEAPLLQEAKADAVTITKNSFKLSASAGDNTSQIAYYEFYIDGVLVETSSSPTYTVGGLTEGSEYQASVKVYDRAGLMTKSVNIPVTTATATTPGSTGGTGTGGSIIQNGIPGPKIEVIEGTQDPGGCYRTDIKIKITDRSGFSETEGGKLRYTVNGEGRELTGPSRNIYDKARWNI